ncbi:hypothetical protein C8Q77DRAFT_570526 [Trametes polyzona]|nr:hypothetical protein C8Q77DRAFT_570526 [Trametes polyzona]
MRAGPTSPQVHKLQTCPPRRRSVAVGKAAVQAGPPRTALRPHAHSDVLAPASSLPSPRCRWPRREPVAANLGGGTIVSARPRSVLGLLHRALARSLPSGFPSARCSCQTGIFRSSRYVAGVSSRVAMPPPCICFARSPLSLDNTGRRTSSEKRMRAVRVPVRVAGARRRERSRECETNGSRRRFSPRPSGGFRPDRMATSALSTPRATGRDGRRRA